MNWPKLRACALACAAAIVAACGGDPPPAVPHLPPPTTAQALPPAPPPDPPPKVEGMVTEQTVNGMLVLVKRVPGAELSAMQLYVRGGVRNWSATNAGIEELAFATAVSGGAGRLDKDAFTKRLAALGSDLSSASGSDFAVLSAKALKERFDDTFDLLAAAFLEPAMPAAEVEIHRQRMLSGLRHEQESPDARLAVLVHRAAFKGHPYENRPVGTEPSVSKLRLDDLKQHLAELRQASRLMLVVAGDVDAAHVAALVRAKLGALPRGAYRESPLPPVSFDRSSVEAVSAPLATNYVQGVFTVPRWKDPEFFAAMVAMQHLGFRVFEEVRTKRNLSYAPSARLRWATGIPLGSLYVTAVDPDTTMKVMFDEVKKLKTTPLTPKDVAAAKSTFLTEHLVSSESTDGQASWLARAQLYADDWRFEVQLLDRVKQVEAQQVQAFANDYIKHLQFEVLGKSPVDKTLLSSL